MLSLVLVILTWVVLPDAEFTVYIYNTNDNSGIEFFDCIDYERLSYCRRPMNPIYLERTEVKHTCYNNGTGHSFASLLARKISVKVVLTQWKSSIDKVEQYARYIKYPTESNGYLWKKLLMRRSNGNYK